MWSTIRRHVRAEGWAALVGLLACVVAFSGRLQSADEIAVYALAYNLAQRGALDINVLASTAPGMRAPPFSGVGKFGPDANFYSGKGVLPSLLAAPLLAAGLVIGADPVVATLTLNALLTVATSFVIARYVRQMLGSERAAFAGGALYATGTLALAYSKRLFTEPAAALGVVLAFVWLTSRERVGAKGIAAGIAFGAAVAASYANLVLLPCLFATVCLFDRRQASQRLAGFLLGVAPWLAGLAIYNFARFGDPLDTGLSLVEWSLPYFTPAAALVRAYGLLFSPYRGLIFYAPILLLLPLAWLLSRAAGRRDAARIGCASARPALFMAATGTLAYVPFFSVWSMWWGGFNWGPRFLLPILPVWMIALTPAFDALLAPSSHVNGAAGRVALTLIKGAMWAVLVLAVFVSTVGGIADTFRSEGELARRGMLNALVKPESPDASPLLTEPRFFQAFSGAWQIVQGELDTWWATSPARDADLARALDDVAERATPGSVVMLVAPARTESFLHAYRLPHELVGLSPDQIRAGEDAPVRRVLAGARRVLLVTDAAQTDPGNTTERWLEAHAFRARNEFYGEWRVAAFGSPPDAWAPAAAPAQFGDALMLVSMRYSPVAPPGGAVAIEAIWQRVTATNDTPDTTDTNDTSLIAWFAHLVAPDGTLAGQHDALLGSGYPWDASSATLRDHRGILVPPDAAPGVYRVNIGAYTGDGARLPVVRGGARLPDDVITFEVTIR
ncbi:MAG: hypothetical protein RMN52_01075 [Anaerolineae bacterium]|nr:hypothetical protein [Candidatus Roseilinea sp.]MDW8448570.1 hypothetical protein [Anaerolineae bacterium]